MPPTTIRVQLLNDLCVRLGFCLPPDDSERLLTWENPEVIAFTDAVFEAEEMSRPYDLHLYRQVRDMVAEALHAEGPSAYVPLPGYAGPAICAGDG